MKLAQRFTHVFVALSALALSTACADSPLAPSRPGQTLSAGGSANFDSAGSALSPADPLLLSGPTAQQASCTVEVLKTSIDKKEKGPGDWVAYDGSVVEVVAPEDLSFKYDLKVDIPEKAQVLFWIEKSVLRPGTSFVFPRNAPHWTPKSLNGKLAGNQTVQLDFKIPKTVGIGNDNVDVQGNTFEITPGWICSQGLDELNRGPLGTFKFKGVEKKKGK